MSVIKRDLYAEMEPEVDQDAVINAPHGVISGFNVLCIVGNAILGDPKRVINNVAKYSGLDYMTDNTDFDFGCGFRF